MNSTNSNTIEKFNKASIQFGVNIGRTIYMPLSTEGSGMLIFLMAW